MATKKKPAPKRGASRYQAPAKKPVPGWVWLVCGLVIGGFFMFLFSLEPGREDVKRAKPEEQKRTAPEPQKKPQAAPEPAKPKYDFYTLLPESEVIVPPDALPPADAPKPPEQKPVTPEEAAKIDAARAQAALNGETPPPPPVVAKAPVTTQFFLQAGSFRKREDADKVRAQILLLGQNVQVESGKVREETWHRVLVGPYANREQLAGAQKQLAGSGFSNLLLQQRQSR
ncbi:MULTISPECIES: SPOR domain-containing protein [unclassified Pseudomonas]|uniref:SPOR domain-containing protein n=1 Tax=unclassified Pseudomonas TaxID=196821 RepID=UPI00244BE5CF|nr:MULTISPECIES: SPOR domain-containing protein [unclassified Pseudomonas]MDG9926669.1 SPOR domain-containing protein [Pseudomonas sp. GD04042]MDH0482262.1 SPOR domain-containing protein [Pseudomonas sp. GD04015]MDH0603697.1 SPOR domain-containing protein [Pseudomonas sp. GD03869]